MDKLTLSKSTFIRGMQCEKSLYMHKYRKDLRDPMPASLEAIFKQGTSVGELAQGLFPGGVDCTPESYYDFFSAVERTKAEIANETKGIMKEEIYELIKSSKENYLLAKAISNSFSAIAPKYYQEILEYLKEELTYRSYVCSIEKANRNDDGLFVLLTDYTIQGGENQEYAIGINIELRSNQLFFCAIEKNKKRNYTINKSKTFDAIANQLKNNSYSLRKSKSGRTNVWLIGGFNFSAPSNDIEKYFEMDEETKSEFKETLLIDVITLVKESRLK